MPPARDVSEPTLERSRRVLPKWASSLVASLIEQNHLLAERATAADRLALSDEISGLPNHRAAKDILLRLLNRHKREGSALSVVFIDGDDLRRHNDISYEAGNAMIAKLAGTLRDRLRPTDYIARWLTGDEFLVILPGVERDMAIIVAERLRRTVQETFASDPLPVTISLGVAGFPEDGEDADTLVQRAMDAKTAAKRDGKNQVAPTGLTPHPRTCVW